MTVYLLDKDMRVREPLIEGMAVDLIHDESNRTITVSVKESCGAQTGEYIAFPCVDGRFRAFCITKAGHDDDKRVIDVTATDAIWQEMAEIIIEELQQLDATLDTALTGLLPDDSWQVTGTAPDRVENSRAYYSTLQEMVQTFETLYEWHIDAYYTFSGGEITGRVLEMSDGAPVFRGRILQSGRDASKVYVTSSGRPYTRLYGIGPATSSGDVQTNLTFADAVWSTANGDPVDKPKGQTWVEDPEAVARWGVHTTKVSITDAEDADDLLEKTWTQLQTLTSAVKSTKATVADLEMVPGYTHMQIRLGDLVGVCLKGGEIVEAKIVAIKRNYFKPWLTSITLGDKADTIQSQVAGLIASATHTFERLTIYKNRFREDEALIQLNAEHIQLNATTIIQHAEQILLKAEQSDMEAVQLMLDGVNDKIVAMAGSIELNADNILQNAKRLDTVADEVSVLAGEVDVNATNIAANAQQITLKASQEDLETVRLTLDGVNGSLTAMAEDIALNAGKISANADQIALNAANIAANAQQITLKASQEDLETVRLTLDGVNGSLTAMAEDIALNADNITLQGQKIELKADVTYVDNLVAGYVKASELEAEVLTVVDNAYVLGLISGENIDAQSLVAASVNTEYMSADSVTTDDMSTSSLSVGGTGAIWKGQTVLTSIGTISQSKRYLSLMTADGGTVTLDVVTNVDISPTSTYIQYLGQ